MKKIELLLEPKLEGMHDPNFRKKLVEECRVFSHKHVFPVLKYLCENNQSYWTQMMFDLKLNPNSLRRCLKPLREYGIVGHNQYGFYITETGRNCLKYISCLAILCYPFDRAVKEFYHQIIKNC